MERQGIRFITNSWDFPASRRYWKLLNHFHKYTFTVLRELFLRLGKSKLAKFLVNPFFYQAASKADLVISVGGHHFTTLLSRDLVSSINYDAMATLALGKPLICFSQTFGPFDFHNERNLRLTRKILQNSTLYVRENQSADALSNFEIPDQCIHATFESVITLNSLLKEYTIPSRRAKRVGIAIYATQKRSPEKHAHYVESLAGLCNYLANFGFQIRFFPMELKGTPPDDRPLIHEIISHTTTPASCFVYDEDMPTEKHIIEVSKCQFFIGHKTHSTIFALATGTPLVGIAYHPKTREFMQQFGVQDYCIDDTNLTMELLCDTVTAILPQLNQIGPQLYAKAQAMSATVKNDLAKIILNQ